MKAQELLCCIEEIINSNYKHDSNVFLTEDGRNATCTNVELRYTGSAYIYKFDQGSTFLLPFFNRLPKIGSMCDYVIFLSTENKLKVFLCNLKSSAKNGSNSIEQIKAGFLFVKYVISSASRYLGVMDVPTFVEYKAIHISNIVTNQTTSAVRKKKKKKLSKKICTELYLLSHNCDNTLILDMI